MEFLATIEMSPVTAALRNSVWAYPLVNTAHILGIAMLFGAILPLDLRLLGFFGRVPLGQLTDVLRPVAVNGFRIALGAGVLLFATDARDYAVSNIFRAKMIVIVLALSNALVLGRVARWDEARQARGALLMRIAGGTSIALWLTVITLGRFIGYF